MEGSSIKAHKASNTLIIAKNANYAKPINYKVNLIAGTNARIMEKISIDGDLELGKGAQVTGDVRAKHVILGPWSVIRGNLTTTGDLVALDHSRVTGAVRCGGSAMIRPHVAFGSLEATGLVEVYGRRPARNIVAKTVATKTDR
ncbi:MAG: hypothetical protein A4E28_02384 [Methanocella sp. PtaU1.Bin125]|nr:MAG: hypothetical protein A4E28_02384 [Methanocella sp. PtaU1.Bin125]